MTLIFKNAKIEDLDLINTIMYLSKSYWGYDEEFMDGFMASFTINEAYLKKHMIKLAFHQEKLVGFYNFSFDEHDNLELENFFLHPHYIGQGFGKALWLHACQTAKALSKDSFIIWSDPHADEFYLNMGAQKIGVRPSPVMPDRLPSIFKYTLSEEVQTSVA